MTEIKETKYLVETVTVPVDFGGDIKTWLEQANTHNFRWLLAHADDGVIWGDVRDDGLHLSTSLFGPELRAKTLQMARLFGEIGELYLWKSDDGWSARLVIEGEGHTKEYYDECQLLWGTDVEETDDGFVLLRHGAEGLRHAPPIHEADIKLPLQHKPLRLNIRHFVDYDKDGQAYVKFSRLISVGQVDGKEEGL